MKRKVNADPKSYKVSITDEKGRTWFYRVTNLKEDDLREHKRITLIDAKPMKETG